MKRYNVIRTDDAEEDLRKYVDYLVRVKRNPQAAQNVLDDFDGTVDMLETMAGSIAKPQSPKLNARNLKRINFQRHKYFLLFRVEGNDVIITNMFHELEDFESKLR